MTHKYADSRLFLRDIPFGRIDPFRGELPTPVVKELTALGTCTVCRKNRLGDIHGSMEGSTHKNSQASGLHRIRRIRFAESMRTKLDAKFICQLIRIGRGIQSNG